MKNTKTVLKRVDYMRCDDLASYLNAMALKGWHFKEWKLGLVFEKGESEEAIYAVEVFTEASENDTRPSPTTKEFAEYCEAAGWKLIDGKQKYCIFKKIQADAVDILTPEERVNNAYKATISGSNMSLLVLYGINACLQWLNFLSFFNNNIFSKSSIYSLVVWNLLFISSLSKIITTYLKRNHLLKLVRNGEAIYIGTNRKFPINGTDIILALLICLLLYDFVEIGGINSIIVTLVIILSSFILSWAIGKFRPDSDTHQIIQLFYGFAIFIFLIGFAGFNIISAPDEEPSVESVPLLASDYKDSTESIEDINIYHNESMFGGYNTYFIWSENDTISYTIYRSDYKWILNRIWEDELDKKVNENVSYCSADWGAITAFKNNANEYLVRYDNTILIFRGYDDEDLTVDQINVIRNKLDLR